MGDIKHLKLVPTNDDDGLEDLLGMMKDTKWQDLVICGIDDEGEVRMSFLKTMNIRDILYLLQICLTGTTYTTLYEEPPYEAS